MVGFPGEKDAILTTCSPLSLQPALTGWAFAFHPGRTEAERWRAGYPIRSSRNGSKSLWRSRRRYPRNARKFVGRVLDVLVERVYREASLLREGVSRGPEVDGLVEIRNISDKKKEGDIVKVRMAEAMPHDMVGEELVQ